MKVVWGNKATTAVLLAACLAGGLWQRAANADQVELVNGDTLTGEVVEQTDRGVVLKHPALGTLAISADRVKAVKRDTDPPAPKPQEQAKPANAGPAPAPPKPAPPQPNAQPADGAEEDSDEPGLFSWFITEWDNKLTIGLNGAGGNTDRQNYYFKFATKYEDGRDRWTANAAWHYGLAQGDVIQNQVNADLTKDWLQETSPWFFFLKGKYQYDTNRDWENRTSAFGGGGYTLAKTDDVEINTRLGFGGTYEFGDVDEFTPEALFGGSVVKWNLTERAALAGEAIYYPSLQDTGQYRVESKLEYTYKLDLAKGLSVKFGLENEYDSRTTSQTGNNDLKYYGALVLSF